MLLCFAPCWATPQLTSIYIDMQCPKQKAEEVGTPIFKEAFLTLTCRMYVLQHWKTFHVT